MKVAIYTRVSTLEQANEGYSIGEQERKLKQFCDINDWKVVDVYVDAGISGGSLKRPSLQKLLNDIDKFDMVLVYKLDRLTRSVRDLLDLLEIFDQNNVAFRSATEVYDTTNAMGRLFVTLVGAMAEWERATITERTLYGKEGALESGKFLGHVPFYYDLVDNKLIPNENRKYVDYIIERLKENISATQIGKELSNMKNTPVKFNKTMVIQILHSPTAHGHTKYGKFFKENTHEPVITQEDYNAAIKILSTRRHTYKQNHASIFRGKIECPNNCGRFLHLNVNKIKRADGSYYLRQYYKCDKCSRERKPSTIIRYDMMQEAFMKYLNNLSFDTIEPPENNDDEKEFEIDIAKVMRQREKYQKAWAMDLMTDDEFKARMKETDKLLEEASEKEVENNELEFEQVVKIQKLLQKSWKNLSEDKKEDLIAATIDKIQIELIKGNKTVNSPNEVKIKDVSFLL